MEDGDRAGLTHTGMMAGPEKVYDALFRRLGVVRVREAQDLFNAASVLYARNRPRGPRLAIMTNADGIGIMATKHLLRSGGKLANLSDRDHPGAGRPHPSLLEPGKSHPSAPRRRYSAGTRRRRTSA